MLRPRYYLEYAALRTIAFSFGIMPYRMALLVGAGLAWIGFHIFSYRKQMAMDRIAEVYGDKYTEAERKKIAWIAFRNFCFTIVELIIMPRLKQRWIDKHVDYKEQFARISTWTENQGCIFVAPHTGNWNLTAAIGINEGLPLLVITRGQKNPLVSKYLLDARSKMNAEMINRHDKDIGRNVMRGLRANKKLCLLFDLRNPVPNEPIQWLGKPAHIADGTGLFAILGKAKVIPMMVVREGWSKQRWIVFDPIEPDLKADKKEERTRIMRDVAAVLEAEVLARPEQYFWINKRWVLQPYTS